jgi:RNA polymerase sigma-70 factor (ECF subfamily)
VFGRQQSLPEVSGVVTRRDAWVEDAYRAHGGELYGFALRALRDSGLAEETVQETFARAWRARAQFDASIGSLRNWLFAIERNLIADLARKRSARVRAEGASVAEPTEAAESLDDLVLGWQIEEALRRIGDTHRMVLVETQLRGRPYAELAHELGVPEGTVKSRVYYGLQALRNVLEEMGYGD